MTVKPAFEAIAVGGWVVWGFTGMRKHPPGLMRLAYWLGLLVILASLGM